MTRTAGIINNYPIGESDFNTTHKENVDGSDFDKFGVKTNTDGRVNYELIEAFVASQCLITDGHYHDGTSYNNNGHVFKIQSKLFDTTNRILFIVSVIDNDPSRANIRSFKFDEAFRVTHRNRAQVDLPGDQTDSIPSFDWDGSHLYFTALNISTNDDFINIKKYSVNTTTAVVNETAVGTVTNQSIGADNTHGTGFSTIVDDTYVYALTTTHSAKFNKTTLAYDSVSSLQIKDSDGTTNITATNISNGWGLTRMNADGTDYYFGSYQGAGTYADSGFTFDASTPKLQRAITLNIDVFDAGDGDSYAKRIAANTQYLEFTYDDLSNIFSGVYMNTSNVNELVVTTL